MNFSEDSIERAAITMCSLDDSVMLWTDLPEGKKNQYRTNVRAVIAALEEPTEPNRTLEHLALSEAWDLGVAHGHNTEGRLLDKWDANPYRKPAK